MNIIESLKIQLPYFGCLSTKIGCMKSVTHGTVRCQNSAVHRSLHSLGPLNSVVHEFCIMVQLMDGTISFF